jgi:hypothetical protein
MTSFWQIEPLVEFQYVITGSPSAAESRSITGCVRSIRTGGLDAMGRLRCGMEGVFLGMNEASRVNGLG